MRAPEYNLFDEAKVLADDRPSEEGNLLEWALDAEHMIRRLVKAFNSTPQPAQHDPTKPVATLWQHGETGRTRITMPDDIADCDARWFKAADLYTSPPAQRKPLNSIEALGWVSKNGTKENT